MMRDKNKWKGTGGTWMIVDGTYGTNRDKKNITRYNRWNNGTDGTRMIVGGTYGN